MVVAFSFAAGFAGIAEFTFVSLGTTLELFVFVSGCGFTGDVVSVAAGAEFKTEKSPVIAGIDSIRAESINNMAALIVTLDKTDCVPRGPNAVLEILLVKSAPASDFPGCSKIVATSTRQERKNNMYNKVTNIFLFVIHDFGKTFSIETGSAD